LEFEALEEVVDDSDLLCSDTLIVVVCVKNNSHGACEEAILLLIRQMDGVHLEIKALSINRMLGERVEMETNCFERLVD